MSGRTLRTAQLMQLKLVTQEVSLKQKTELFLSHPESLCSFILYGKTINNAFVIVHLT